MMSDPLKPMIDVTEVVGGGMARQERRHDVDWVRVLALLLLIIYHCVIAFQPWAQLLLFIQNGESLESLWPLMALINVWRIPILFYISGMGVWFSMQRRDWKQLLAERSKRILLPLVFGFFLVCPISVYIGLTYYDLGGAYAPNLGHLWFLANIFGYVLLLLPVLVLIKRHAHGRFLSRLRKLFAWWPALLILPLPIAFEAWMLVPDTFSMYALTSHGFWMGLILFFLGFACCAVGVPFWKSVQKARHFMFMGALALYLIRLLAFDLEEAWVTLTGVESMLWILAILGFAARHLNRPSAALKYLSAAVYPVYIVHMPWQYALSFFLLPSDLPAVVKLVLLTVGVLALSMLSYEVVLKRLGPLRLAFGMKWKQA
jgi:glucan biosynthesis protein C